MDCNQYQIMIFAANICKNQILKLSSEKEGTLIIKNISIDPQSQQAFIYMKVPYCQQKTLVAKLNQLSQCAYHTSIQLPLNKKSSQQLISLKGKVHLIGNFTLKEDDCSIKNIKNVLNIDKYSYQLQIKEDDEFKSQLQVSGQRIRRSRYQVKTALKQKSQKTVHKLKGEKKKGQKKEKSLLQMMNDIGDDQQDGQDQSYEEEQEGGDQSESQSSQQNLEQQVAKTQKLDKSIKKQIKASKIQQKKTKLVKKQNKSLNWASALTNLQEDEDEQDESYQSKSQQQSQSDQSSESQSGQNQQFEGIKAQQKHFKDKKEIKKSTDTQSKGLNYINQEKPFQYIKPQKIPAFVFKD